MRITTSFISTDYTCSPCVSVSNLGWYIISAESLKDEFVRCGVPSEKLVASVLPEKRAFTRSPTRRQPRRRSGLTKTCVTYW